MLLNSRDGIQWTQHARELAKSKCKRSVKFSYIERSTKEWINRRVIGKRRKAWDVGLIQQQIYELRVVVQIHPIGKSFCFISFPDEETLSASLRDKTLEGWFSDVNSWEESDFVDGSLRWVCMKGVPKPLWNYQFFSFVVADFGQLVDLSKATAGKLNLQEAWLKVRCTVGCP